MNVWSVPTVMSANKPIRDQGSGIRGRFFPTPDPRSLLVLLLALFVALPSHAQAQESAAQALYSVKEILVRPVKFDDPAVAKTCRLDSADLDQLILGELKSNGLPAIPEANSRPSTTDIARIILLPQIVPYNSQGLDCVTWVAFSAESRNHLRVLPIEIPRVVKVVYWNSGELVASAVSVHGDHVTESLQHMLKHFGDRYKLAQPPTVGATGITPPPR